MKILLVATNRVVSPYPVAPLGVLCVAGGLATASDLLGAKGDREAQHPPTVEIHALLRHVHEETRKINDAS